MRIYIRAQNCQCDPPLLVGRRSSSLLHRQDRQLCDSVGAYILVRVRGLLHVSRLDSLVDLHRCFSPGELCAVCVCVWVGVCAVKFKSIRLVGERKALSRSPHLARGEKAICCSVRAPDKRGHRSETNEREPAQTACDSRQQGRVTEATHLRLWRVMRTVHSVKSDVHSKTRSVVRMTSISVCCAAHTSTPPLIPTIHCTSLPNAPPYKRLGSTSCTKERGDGASEASVSFASTKTPVF
jgi:hypothetical protein